MCVAYPPWDAPKTRSPTLNWGVLPPGSEDGTCRTTPANSDPAIQGKGGWSWYLPRIWSRSKKFVAEAWMAIRYSFGFGVRAGRETTLRSSGPLRVLGGTTERMEREDHVDVFFDLYALHAAWLRVRRAIEREEAGGDETVCTAMELSLALGTERRCQTRPGGVAASHRGCRVGLPTARSALEDASAPLPARDAALLSQQGEATGGPAPLLASGWWRRRMMRARQ